MALTSPAPIANDPVRKYAHSPSPTTRQSSTPSDAWNCFGLILLDMRAYLSPKIVATVSLSFTLQTTWFVDLQRHMTRYKLMRGGAHPQAFFKPGHPRPRSCRLLRARYASVSSRGVGKRYTTAMHANPAIESRESTSASSRQTP